MVMDPRHFDLEADEVETFEERAAIREYLGGLPRDEAERLARLEVLALRRSKDPDRYRVRPARRR